MNNESRTKNAGKNITSAFLNKIAILILTFVSRKVFIQFIGIEYLGINSLFANILTLLSIADLGIGTAMNVRLYKPIAENDKEKISAILNYFKVVYYVIAAVVLTIGLALIPVLPYIVNMDKDIPHLYLFYVILVLKNVFSYLFVYKGSILKADQKTYVVNMVDIFITVLTIAAQIVVIVTLKNYLLYLLIGVLSIIIHNVVVSLTADKYYSFIKNSHSKLSKEEQKEIFSDVSSAFVYKVSKAIINGTDNILISILIGTVTVGIYTNYHTITSNIDAFIVLAFSALTAGVGNLIAKECEDKRFSVFKIVRMICFWLCTYCSISLLFLTQDFIALYFGSELLLDNLTLISIVLAFYVSTCMKPILTYREGSGMYKKIKWVMLISAVLNIILSIVLGKLIGLSGIFFATSISKLLTYFWVEPIMLYRTTFKKSVGEYFVSQLLNVLLFAISFGLCFIPIFFIKTISILTWFLKAGICLIIVNTVYFLVYFKTPEFKDTLSRFKLSRKKPKND